MADGDKANYVLALIDRITAPARKMLGSTRRMREALASTKGAADSASAAVDKMGASTEAAGKKALKGAAAMKRAASQMRVAKMSTSYANLAGRGPGQLAAAGQLGMIGKRNTGNAHAFGGGRLMSRGVQAVRSASGPILDRSAQGAAAGNMGPVLNRSAQKLGVIDRLDVATKKLRDWNWKMGESIEKWGKLKTKFAGTPFGKVAGGFASIAASVASLALEIGSMVVQAGLAASALLLVATAIAALKVVEKAAFAERAKKSLGSLTGSAKAGVEAYKQARRVAQELGQDAEHTVQSFIELRAAQFTLGEAETLVKLSADLQTVTGEADAAERAIRAITQIKAKGRVQTEELLQLSEAGLSLDLVFGELAKIMGKTRPELQKAMLAGKVDAVKGVEAIQNAIMHKLHETKAGDVAKATASSTLSGLMTQLKNIPGNIALDIGELINIEGARGVVQDLLTALDGVNRTEMATFFDNVIKSVKELVRVGIEFGKGFGDEIGTISAAMGETFDAGQWRLFGAAAARAFALVIKVTKFFIKLAGEIGEWIRETTDAFGEWDAWTWTENIVGLVPVIGSLLALFVRLIAKVAEFIGLRDEALGIKKKVVYAPPPPVPHLFPYADPKIQAEELAKKYKTPAIGSAFPNSRPQYQGTGTPTPRADVWSPAAGAGGNKTQITFGKMDVQVPAAATATPAAFGKAVRAEVAAALAEFADRNMGEMSHQ